ncbi:uncharacterized protein LOC110252917 [Exaiptasia diaphana]|uniref:Uncharacterized protein n=1 Tax=Exaiptasia diaphana TaxID=2652724 RepID=A0A913Y5G2_EXADI|nr:uncharacterized protein LOC110252917 [Exaiptasia diaphana]
METLFSTWSNIKEAYIHACKTVLGKRKRKFKTWITEETWNLIDTRRNLKEKKQSSRSTRLLERYNLQYTETNKEIKRRLRQDKRAYYDKLSLETERLASRGELSLKFTKLQENYPENCKPVRDENGVKIMQEEEQLKRWAEHFTKVLNRPPPPITTITDFTFGDVLDINCDPPTEEEV